ncbi:related to transposase [Fusarium oxysporum]|uniref:Related to transposase n=1 Tax=Fusarium oxysporum TaxID=5507 RepID=A0A2H3TT00_FUSOX|nr:related to transposase [Fusarium oxysporum]
MSQSTAEARIILALEAYQADPKLSLRRAAFLYDVHFQTLHHRSQGRQARDDYIPSSRKLSDQEEQLIVEYILNLDSRGFPSRHRDIEEMANRLLAERDASPVGKRWAINFIKRQPQLKTRSFLQARGEYNREYGIRSDDIWNFDETGFMMGVISSGKVITSSERHGNPKSVQPGNREWVTAI